MIVKVKKLTGAAKLPSKATPGSACWDIFSVEDVTLLPQQIKLVSTGLSYELPNNMGLDIRPRSGLASKGLVILNSPGTLDSDYRGELKVSFINLSDKMEFISKGDRIAQIGLLLTVQVKFEEVLELSSTERGEGGFGSTGK